MSFELDFEKTLNQILFDFWFILCSYAPYAVVVWSYAGLYIFFYHFFYFYYPEA